MAHEIEKNYAFFASSTPAWHGLGTVLKDAPSIEQAWQLAYPFTVHKLQNAALMPRLKDDGTEAIDNEGKVINDYLPLDDTYSIFRSDGKHLGQCGSRYEIVQPYQQFDFARPYIDSGLVELEAGGSLFDGKQSWALAKVKKSEIEIAKGDTVKAHLLIAGSFDGSLPHMIRFCETRVVCANTLAVAKSEKGDVLSFRHTKNIHIKLEQAQKQIGEVLEQHKKTTDIYKSLAAKKVTSKQVEKYISDVLLPENAKTEDSEISTKQENILRYVLDLTYNQKNYETVPAIRGTAWEAYNGLSQYLTHDYGNSADSRVSALWFGKTRETNQKALELAMVM